MEYSIRLGSMEFGGKVDALSFQFPESFLRRFCSVPQCIVLLEWQCPPTTGQIPEIPIQSGISGVCQKKSVPMRPHFVTWGWDSATHALVPDTTEHPWGSFVHTLKIQSQVQTTEDTVWI